MALSLKNSFNNDVNEFMEFVRSKGYEIVEVKKSHYSVKGNGVDNSDCTFGQIVKFPGIDDSSRQVSGNAVSKVLLTVDDLVGMSPSVARKFAEAFEALANEREHSDSIETESSVDESELLEDTLDSIDVVVGESDGEPIIDKFYRYGSNVYQLSRKCALNQFEDYVNRVNRFCSVTEEEHQRYMDWVNSDIEDSNLRRIE